VNRRGVVRVASCLGALLVALIVGVAIRVALPRIEHRRRVKALVERFDRQFVTGQAVVPEDEGLLLLELHELDDPEVPLALLRAVTRHGYLELSLRRAVELFACSSSVGDTRVPAALEALARDPKVPDMRRLWAFYLIEELASPSYPAEPLGFASDDLVEVKFRADTPEIMASIAAAARVRIEVSPTCAGAYGGHTYRETPWRALVRVAQSESLSIETSPDVVRVTPRRRWDLDLTRSVHEVLADIRRALGAPIVFVPPLRIEDIDFTSDYAGPEPHALDRADPVKALRALAALNGCSVTKNARGEYEVRRP
jgi:hypothetical protein